MSFSGPSGRRGASAGRSRPFACRTGAKDVDLAGGEDFGAEHPANAWEDVQEAAVPAYGIADALRGARGGPSDRG